MVAVLPFLLVVVLTLRYGVDVPLVDQWELPPLLERAVSGTLTLDSLFSQNYEHRIPVPLLIMFGLARLTGWNVRWELVVNLTLASLHFVALLSLLGLSLRSFGTKLPIWAPAVLSLLVFSLCQYENWLWGWTICFFLNVLCVSAGVLTLGRANRAWEFALAFMLGVIASFSLGNGLFYWWVGLVPIAFADAPWLARVRRLVPWVVASTVVHLVFFRGYALSAVAGERLSPMRSPWAFAHFVLTFLGSPVASYSGSAFPPRDSGIAAVVGMGGVVLFAAMLISLIRSGAKARRAAAPFTAIGAYALLSGAAAAVNRATLGVGQAMAPRYTTISILFWVGLMGLLLLAWIVRSQKANQWTPGAKRSLLWLSAALLVSVVISSLICVPVFALRWRLLEPVRGAVLQSGPDSLLQRLHPDVNLVRKGIVILRSARLSVFRDEPTRLGIRSVAVPLKAIGQILALEGRMETVRAGENRRARIRVTNPTNEEWSALGDGTGVFSVRLSYHWLREDGTAVIFDGERTPLPMDLGPGRTVQLNARLVAPPNAGRFVLVWTMLQEQVNWFDAAGAGALKMTVQVTP